MCRSGQETNEPTKEHSKIFALSCIWWYCNPISSPYIPRPSHHPVLDCLQYAETEGEDLGTSTMWMISIGRQSCGREGSQWPKARSRGLFWGGIHSSTTHVFANFCSGWHETCSFGWVPLSLYLGRHHSHDKCSQAFPLHFCILKAIENWMVGMAWEGKLGLLQLQGLPIPPVVLQYSSGYRCRNCWYHILAKRLKTNRAVGIKGVYIHTIFRPKDWKLTGQWELREFTFTPNFSENGGIRGKKKPRC